MPMFRKKPVEIEAQQLGQDNAEKIVRWIVNEGGDAHPRFLGTEGGSPRGASVLIHTLEGTMAADPGDWIIRGVKDEFYPCKPDIFEATYEALA